MDSFHAQLDRLRSDASFSNISTTAILSYAIALLFLAHQILYQFDIAALPVQEFCWNALVYLTPARLVLDAQKQKELGSGAMWSQTHAAKSAALRRTLGMSGQTLMQQVPSTADLARRLSGNKTTKTDAPPGLGNWDNSCYQNSVLQGLSTLTSLEKFLMRWSDNKYLPEQSTLEALRETTTKLRDSSNNGQHIWTPAKLKSMSSWQQQDAQEYFSKIMDELEKDVSKAQKASDVVDGLETVVQTQTGDGIATTTAAAAITQNPLEGLLAQRVACTACGFSEGLSMIPFNCLTVPLAEGVAYKLETCLDEYTKLEDITNVECAKCTLLKADRELVKMTTPSAKEQVAVENNPLLNLPPEIRAQVMQRLEAVKQALDCDDFSDDTINQKCLISKKSRVSSTKTRQALIGRAPASLIVHVNRSVFDEVTGMLRKNYAAVRYPATLDLGPWILGASLEDESSGGLPREDLWKYIYRLKAIVTHYGRHENGHYIAYRQSPASTNPDDDIPKKQEWWRLSDEDVSRYSEEDVLAQGGVFMLFYERVDDISTQDCQLTTIHTAASTSIDDAVTAVSVAKEEEHIRGPAAHHTNDNKGNTTSEALATKTDIDTALHESPQADVEATPAIRRPSPPSPFMMRTANVDRSNDDHWNVGRFIAAT